MILTRWEWRSQCQTCLTCRRRRNYEDKACNMKADPFESFGKGKGVIKKANISHVEDYML